MEICKSAKCTGCGVCVDACPKNCIALRHDENGFYQSCVNEDDCIRCGRCRKVCPANHPNNTRRIRKAYKARRTDKEAAALSTSGGIAAVLSEYVIRCGGTVAGCGYDGAMLLRHSLASAPEELEAFKGSKYLQSYTVGIYRLVREQLKTGKPVLFVGTPCQVAALQNYVGKEQDNLYTVDFVCHGVSSQSVFDKFLASVHPTERPVSIRFRNKTQGYRSKRACFELQVEYADQTVRSSLDEGVYCWFASALTARESCYACPFVSVDRASDLTLADYIGKDLDDEDNEIGVSTVFVNSDKGAALLGAVQDETSLTERDPTETVLRYDRMLMSAPKPACRKRFFADLPNRDYAELARTYTAAAIAPGKMRGRYYAMKRRFCRLRMRGR